MSNETYFDDWSARRAQDDASSSNPRSSELLTLGIDTATEKRSVALMLGSTVMAERSNDLRESSAASVLVEIDSVLKSVGRKVSDVELFAAAIGPGSFTGLRAGIATLKALAVTLRKPAQGVPTLHALAMASGPAARAVAMIPAGRGEVFAQFLSVDESGRVVELSPAWHLPPSRVIEMAADNLNKGIKWMGSGAEKHGKQIEETASKLGRRVVVAESVLAQPREDQWLLAPQVKTLAVSVGRLAQDRYTESSTPDRESLVPLYVRPSDAELKEPCRASG